MFTVKCYNDALRKASGNINSKAWFKVTSFSGLVCSLAAFAHIITQIFSFCRYNLISVLHIIQIWTDYSSYIDLSETQRRVCVSVCVCPENRRRFKHLRTELKRRWSSCVIFIISALLILLQSAFLNEFQTPYKQIKGIWEPSETQISADHETSSPVKLWTGAHVNNNTSLL